MFLPVLLCLGLLAPKPGIEAPVRVFVVAGQSNVLNWHAAASALPPDPNDADILFWHASGAPANRGFETPVNATSERRWVPLNSQEQKPYVRYERKFFGPEISLARTLQKTGAGPVAIIKVGFFGTTLAEDWNPTAPTGNRLYAVLLDEIISARAALDAAGHRHTLGGIFWMQGESDARREDHAVAYAKNLQGFIDALRRDFASPEIPFILGRIGPSPPRGYPFQQMVRTAQEASAEIPWTAWTDTDDLARDKDAIHLIASGVIGLGERWAAEWTRLRFPKESTDATSPSKGAGP